MGGKLSPLNIKEQKTGWNRFTYFPYFEQVTSNLLEILMNQNCNFFLRNTIFQLNLNPAGIEPNSSEILHPTWLECRYIPLHSAKHRRQKWEKKIYEFT